MDSGSFLLNVTQAFFITINKNSFASILNSSTDELEYLTSVTGMADLPDWIHYKYVPKGTSTTSLHVNTQSGQGTELKTNGTMSVQGQSINASSASVAYLYGSPVEEGDVELEIVAVNKETYQTSRDTIKLTIQEKESKLINTLLRVSFFVELSCNPDWGHPWTTSSMSSTWV